LNPFFSSKFRPLFLTMMMYVSSILKAENMIDLFCFFYISYRSLQPHDEGETKKVLFYLMVLKFDTHLTKVLLP
jgi:hypothetical protein